MKTISIWICACTLIAIFAVGCGDTALTVQRTRVLDGKWSLAEIRCGGEESAVLPSNALAAGAIASEVHFDGEVGERIWQIPPGCTVTTRLTAIAYPVESVIRLTDQGTSCSGTCDGIPACGTGAQAPSDYPFVLKDKQLAVTLPSDVKARETLPCGPGQSTDVIEFIYHEGAK